MSRIKLRDEDIARAAALVCEAMILPDQKDCRYTFSEAFERKMERLIRVEKRHSNSRMFLKRALAIVVATLLSMTTWLAIDTDARAAFTKWIREVYENCIVYRSMGEEASAEIPEFTIADMPEEYAIVDKKIISDHGYVVWKSTRNEEDRIVLEYTWNDDSRLNVVLEPDRYDFEKIEIDGNYIEWYESKTGTDSNLMIWIEDDGEIVFSIESYLEKLEVLHMSESIRLAK